MMAPEPSNHKRKRVRPPNASRQEADASQDRSAAAEEHDADADEGRRPRKRGRLRKDTEPAAEESAAPKNPEPARRRGRSSRVEGKAMATQATVEGEEVAPRTNRKRGRSPLSNKEADGEAAEGGGPSSRRGKNATVDGQTQAHQDVEFQAGPREKRGKKRAEKNQQQQQQEEEERQATEPPPRQRRGRRRPSPQGRQEVEENLEAAGEQRPKPRNRGRPSLQDMPPAEVRNKASKPGKAGRSSKADETTAVEDTQAKKTGKPRRPPSGGSRASIGDNDAPQPSPQAAVVESQAGPAESSPGQKKKRRRSGQNAAPEEDDNAPPSPPKPYPHIAPHVRRVRQATIEAKWSPLAESSLSAGSAILHLAHHPILQRLSNTQQRRTHTSAALRLVTHRITRKVARGLPFPPASLAGRAPRSGRAAAGGGGDGGRAAELDFESVLDAKQALERQLDPALHAVELLTREKEKLERELERDYEALRNLESSARAQAREHRGLLKKAHVLAPTPETVALKRKGKQESDVIFRHDGTRAMGGLLDNLKDDEEELKSLALQLGDHVESIKNNLQQTDGIVPQLAHTRAALQDVLFRCVDQEQYDHVVLG